MHDGNTLTKERVPRYKLQLSETSKSFVVKPKKTAIEKKYIDDLMLELINLTQKPYSYKPKLPALPDMHDKPEKEDVIRKKFPRFRSCHFKFLIFLFVFSIVLLP